MYFCDPETKDSEKEEGKNVLIEIFDKEELHDAQAHHREDRLKEIRN